MSKWRELGSNSLIQISRLLAREMGLDNAGEYGSRSFYLGKKSMNTNPATNKNALELEATAQNTSEEREENSDATKEKTNFVLARRQFRRCKQEAGEGLDEFTARLKELAESCGFCDERCTDENLLEQLVEGLHDTSIAQKLLDVPGLTTEAALSICEEVSKVEGMGNEPIAISETDIIEECLSDIDGNVAEGREKVNGDDAAMERDEEQHLDDLDFVYDEDCESGMGIINKMETDFTGDLLDCNNSVAAEGEGLSVSEDLSSQEHENSIPNPTVQSSAVVQDIQDTIGSALKSEELSPKHLLSIMQKMFELQKNTLDKKEGGSRCLAEETNIKEKGIKVEKAEHVQVNPFSEEFTPTMRKTPGKKTKEFWRQETVKAYERVWREFGAFINSSGDITDHQDNREQMEMTLEPSEEDYLGYLTYLSGEKQLKNTTVVNMFSRLNSSHMSRFKRSPLRIYPGLQSFVSTLNSMEVKSTRARKFSKEQIQRALQLDRGTSSEWIMKKAAISIAFCGGLSIREFLKALDN